MEEGLGSPPYRTHYLTRVNDERKGAFQGSIRVPRICLKIKPRFAG